VKNLLKTLGPGILFASTAIGVSHLVQSTQAGAYFGFNLLWALLLANLFKYPFFEYGRDMLMLQGRALLLVIIDWANQPFGHSLQLHSFQCF